MKNIVAVNFSFPSIDQISYQSGQSLLDYDIVLFDPEFPKMPRIDFTGGGSCITIEGAERLKTAIAHWGGEIKDALKAGKTIFFLLNDYEIDSGAAGYSIGTRGVKNYTTSQITNYDVLPTSISIRNAKGKHLKVVDAKFKGLYALIKDISEYKVVFTSEIRNKLFTTRDGSNVISAISRFKDLSGCIVYLPYFDISELKTYSQQGGSKWKPEATRISKGIVSQLVEIDKLLSSQAEGTPKPEWMNSVDFPKKISEIDMSIQKFEEEIIALHTLKDAELMEKEELIQYSALLFENGKPLEKAVEKSLQLLGYTVENFKDGDIEIDHLISHTNGIRMIGESEGKDNSAIDISKFRQLESNINEDFERDDVEVPAKGIIFGNGHRLVEPHLRADQFTQKCLTNAKRLGTALVKTVDLYEVVVYVLDNANDKQFQTNCRKAIESTTGEVVEFPKPKIKIKPSLKKTN
ncbi:hypothetical protein FA048_12580 [Pedobacter polaris]|uniref:Uncharacterized protein n=1 Tax=Pedobacter polaris TaxID=2571273 RepID=A0A4U1CK26_9SPHI|nr:hypothetical protein [Pedobacter polaris]TKC07994.1 hypothetical protein FA048_12580 [Pedobacter polaris]